MKKTKKKDVYLNQKNREMQGREKKKSDIFNGKT